MQLNLYRIFKETAQSQPYQPAFLGPGMAESMTYQAADAAIAHASERLARAGVGPRACVGLHCPGGPSYILATYAAWKCGACVVPIPTELTRPEKEEILRTVAIDFVIGSGASFLEPYRRSHPTALWAESESLHVVSVARLREPPAGFAALNAAFVRFTSGTTAAAKGVVLSHETIHERIRAANQALEIGPQDRVVWLLSMAYHFAVSIVAYLSFGAGIVFPSNHFAQAVLAAARKHRGTLIYGSPAHFAWLASHPEAGRLADLRLAISTTASLDGGTAERFRERFGVSLGQALGIIEVGLPFINPGSMDSHSLSVGKVVPAYGLRLEDAGVGDGTGEILLRGPGMLDAYYDPWRPRSAVLADGWFHTGDIASMDADGFVTLRGRLKDVISVLGMKFFPQEVEAVLANHPAVEEAAVYARPDPRLGETPHARIRPRPGQPLPAEHELIALCEKQLASYKVPRQIEFVAELPRTASGKLLHRASALAGKR